MEIRVGIQSRTVKELLIHLQMEEDEPRFGYSVMGGEDEGFPPRVDEVSLGE